MHVDYIISVILSDLLNIAFHRQRYLQCDCFVSFVRYWFGKVNRVEIVRSLFAIRNFLLRFFSNEEHRKPISMTFNWIGIKSSISYSIFFSSFFRIKIEIKKSKKLEYFFWLLFTPFFLHFQFRTNADVKTKTHTHTQNLFNKSSQFFLCVIQLKWSGDGLDGLSSGHQSIWFHVISHFCLFVVIGLRSVPTNKNRA